MSQLYCQLASRPNPWLLGRTSAGLCTLQTACPLTVTYSGGSPAADTIAAGSAATVYGGSAATFDAGADVWVVLTAPGSGAVQVAKEADLATVTGDWAGLARIVQHAMEPYQPQASLAAGGLGGAAPTTTAPCLSGTVARCHNVSPPTNVAETDYPGWTTPGFADGAWAHAVVAHHETSQDPEVPAGASSIDDLATRPNTEGAQKLLVRQTFTLPSGAPLAASLSGGADAWGDFYVNGTHIGQAGATDGSGSAALAATDVPPSLLLPGATNVVAVQIQDLARTSVHNRFCAFALTVSYAGGAIGNPGGSEGDLLYYHHGAWSDLPVGTSGQRLASDGTDPYWATGGSGTVTSVALAGPTGTTVSGSPITASGTLTLSWASQTANTVLAAPNGSSGAPTFRALVGNDIPVDASTIVSSAGTIKGNYQAGSGVSISGNTISATGSGGSVTSVALSLPGLFSLSGSPITTSGTLTVTLANENVATVFAGPASGSAAAPTFRALQGSDLPPAAAAGGHVHAHGHFH